MAIRAPVGKRDVSAGCAACYPVRMGRRGVLVAAGVVVAALAWLWLGPSESSYTYATAEVVEAPLVAEVTATGRVDPRTSVEVGTYVSGPIRSVDVDFNEVVRAGQRLAQIDPRTFDGKVAHAKADLTLAEAHVQRAEAALELARSRLGRSESLAGKAVVSSEELEVAHSDERQAEAELAVARAEVERARAALDEATVNREYTDILAPIDGVVLSRNVQVGQTVAATFQTPVLFVLAGDLQQMQVLAFVNEADVGRVREGQTATFTVDAYPGRTFEATVRQVRHTSAEPETPEPVVSYVVTYDVVLDVANPDGALRPGMTANVRIVTARKESVLQVPNAALRFRPPASDVPPTQGERGAVFRLSAGRPEPVGVAVGLSDDLATEVAGDGISAGDRVVTRMEKEDEGSGWSLFGRRRR